MLQDAKPRMHYRNTELISLASSITGDRVKQGFVETIEAMRHSIIYKDQARQLSVFQADQLILTLSEVKTCGMQPRK